MATSRYLPLSRSTVHLVEHGGRGRPMVLVHGLGGASTNWVAVAPGLAGMGRVIAVDLPGFGLSPPAPRCDLAAHSRTVIDVLEWAGGDPSVLVGNSMGGLVAELVAAARPDLVEELVLVAPATPLAPRTFPVDGSLMGLLAMQSLPGLGRVITRALLDAREPDQQVARTLSIVAADPISVPASVIDAAIGLARSRRTLPWVARAFHESIASIRSHLFPRGRFERIVSRIQSPALLVSGRHDRLVGPASMDWLASLAPGWVHHRFEQLGHVPQMEDPAGFLEVVSEFLNPPLTKETRPGPGEGGTPGRPGTNTSRRNAPEDKRPS